jgi:hypothetical protein
MGVAPPGGGECPGADRLLIRKSRLSQMNVDINETGKNSGVMKINGNGELQPPGNGNDTASTDRDVGGTEDAAVQQHGVFQNTVHRQTPSRPVRPTGMKAHLSNLSVLVYRRGGGLSTGKILLFLLFFLWEIC